MIMIKVMTTPVPEWAQRISKLKFCLGPLSPPEDLPGHLKCVTRVLERKEGVFKIEPSVGRAIKRKECLPEPVYPSRPISRDAILFVLR